MTNPILELQEVRKVIQGKTILQPLSYSLQKGEILALCGGNGAGKSTLLRMIAGLSQPASGRILVNGCQWKQDRHAYAASLGYMPDDFFFGYSLTAGETLEFYARLRGIKSRARVDEVLEEVGLRKEKGTKVSAFSKGMRQRLLFGQALLAEPKLLVLDEPTNGLDPYWLRSFAMLVNQRKARGQSIVFSTHHLEVAEMTADHAVMLHEGAVVEAGPMEEFRSRYGAGGLTGAFSKLFGAWQAPSGEEGMLDEAPDFSEEEKIR